MVSESDCLVDERNLRLNEQDYLGCEPRPPSAGCTRADYMPSHQVDTGYQGMLLGLQHVDVYNDDTPYPYPGAACKRMVETDIERYLIPSGNRSGGDA